MHLITQRASWFNGVSVLPLQPESSELPNPNDVSYNDDVSICVDSARILAEIIRYQLEHDIAKVQCMADAAHSGAALLIRYIWWLKAKEKAQQEELQDVKPPLVHIIDEIMGYVAVFTRALETAAPRSEMAAQALYVSLLPLRVIDMMNMLITGARSSNRYLITVSLHPHNLHGRSSLSNQL